MVSKVSFDFQEHRGMCVSLGVLGSSDLRDRIAKGFVEKFPAGENGLCRLIYEAESMYVIEEPGSSPKRELMKHYTITPVMDKESDLVDAFNQIVERLLKLNPEVLHKALEQLPI